MTYIYNTDTKNKVILTTKILAAQGIDESLSNFLSVLLSLIIIIIKSF